MSTPSQQTDAGMSALLDRFRTDLHGEVTAGAAVAGGPGDAGAAAAASLGARIELGLGRLAAAVERANALQEATFRRLQRRLQGVAPIWLPPVSYTVAGGNPKLDSSRASSADFAPSDGYVWFLTHLVVAGLAAGDTVTLSKASTTGLNNVLHVFTGAQPDWALSSSSVFLLPDDFLVLSGSGLTSTQLVLSGQAVQVESALVADYLM